MKSVFNIIAMAIILLMSPLNITYAKEPAKPQKTIIVAAPSNFHPFSFISSSGYPEGFSVELIDAIMKEAGMPYKLVCDENMHMMEDKLNNGEIDVMLVKAYSNDKAGTQHNFSSPYYTGSYNLVVRSDSQYKSMSQLKGKKVGVRVGTFEHALMLSYGSDIEIVEVDNTELCLKMLSQGELDAAICCERNALSIMQNGNITNLKMYNANLPDAEFCFTANEPMLSMKMSKALNTLIERGEYQELYQKWFGIRRYQFMHTFYWIIALASVLGLIMLIFIYMLRRRVRLATASLKESNRRISYLNRSVSMLMDNSDIMVYLYDIAENKLYNIENGDFSYCAQGMIRRFERNIISEDAPRYKDFRAKLLAGEIKEITTLSLRSVNEQTGKERDCEYIVSVEKDEKGKPQHILCLQKDETEHRHLLRKQGQIITSLDLALCSANLISWQYKVSENIYKVVDCNLNKYAFSEEEWYSLIDEDDRERFRQFAAQVMSNESGSNLMELHLKLPSSEQFKSYELTATVKIDNGKATYMYGILNDVSTIHSYQNQIGELQENIKMALQAGDLAIWTYNMDEESIRVLHADNSKDIELSKVDLDTYIHPDDRHLIEVFKEKIRNKDKNKNVMLTRFGKSGAWRWYECSFIIDDRFGNYVTGILKDVTTELATKRLLNQKNEELQKSEERQRMILNRLPIPVYITDTKAERILYINESGKKFFNADKYEFVSDVLQKRDIPMLTEFNAKLSVENPEVMGTEQIHLKNGRSCNTYVKKLLLSNNNLHQILVVRMDLTEQHRAEILNKVVSISLPSLRAYSWYVDMRDGKLNCVDTLFYAERDLKRCASKSEFVEYVHPDDRAEYIKKFDELMQMESGEISVFFRADIEKIGNYEWWESRSVVETHYDNNGWKYKLMYGIDINVNANKTNEIALQQKQTQLVELNRQNKLILDNITSAIVYMDTNYRIQWSNFKHVFGKFGEEFEKMYVQGDYCYSSHNLSEPCIEYSIADAIKSNGLGQKQFTIGEHVFLANSLCVEGEHGCEGFVTRIDDITSQEHLIDDLRKAKRRAEESDRMKSAFLANMSHEIRTPLNAIVGFSELIQYTDDANERAEYINIINNNNQLLLRLVNDVLDLSKIESGTVDLCFEPFDASLVIDEIYLTFKNRFEGSSLEFILNNKLKSCEVNLDRNRFNQVVTNFLTNAQKYTAEGSVTLSLDVDGDGMKVSVTDTGIGISEKKHHLVFQRFEKLDSFAQGTGLGLSISKAIVEAMHGRIGFESEEGKGSTFWAWFPCNTSSIARAE